jgi:hypothetical protein
MVLINTRRVLRARETTAMGVKGRRSWFIRTAVGGSLEMLRQTLIGKTQTIYTKQQNQVKLAREYFNKSFVLRTLQNIH